MITQEMHDVLVNHYEFIHRNQRPEWYQSLTTILESEKLSYSEAKMRTEAWDRYYQKVREVSPAAQLFEEWKKWTFGTGTYSKEKLQEMTNDMKVKGLPEIEGRPHFPDPYEIKELARKSESAAHRLMKQKPKKKSWEES